MAKVSLICTVLNEADNIAELIEAIMVQTRQPDEIVINDCGSRDGTVQIIEDFIRRGYPIKLVHGGRSISTGRNNAIRHAQGPIIVRIDAGLTLDREYVAQLVAPVERGEADFTVGHAYVEPQSIFEAVSGAMTYIDLPRAQKIIAGGEWHTPGRNGAAYRRTDWDAVGGYAEYLDANEDRVMGLRMRRLGKRYKFVPEAKVYFRPRETFRAFFKQQFTYASWSSFGRNEGLMRGRKNLDYTVRLLGGLALPVLIVRALFSLRLAVIMIVAALGWLARERYTIRSLFHGWPLGQQITGTLLILPIRLVREYARLYGTTIGLRDWLRKRPALPDLPGAQAPQRDRAADPLAYEHSSSD